MTSCRGPGWPTGEILTPSRAWQHRIRQTAPRRHQHQWAHPLPRGWGDGTPVDSAETIAVGEWSYGSRVDSLNAYDIGWLFGVIVTLWVIYLALR